MAPDSFRELPHPADLCLQVWGGSRAELYEHAAEALFRTLDYAVGPQAAALSFDIALHAPDPETLMVDWLDELLYQGARQRACWRAFVLNQVTPTGLSGIAHGLAPAMPRREVKAVTYTGLSIAQDEQGRWSATITFDV